MPSDSAANGCASGIAAGVRLPVVGRPTRIRPSRMSLRRTAVLIAVHVVIVAHILHWLSAGSTLTPLEPSEAMEFGKHSVINAGVVLFALAILSTLLLGRWFCGWGCHLVALQDLARWLLGKIHLRPKPLRSSILVTVPLLAFLYMFVAPLAYRLMIGEEIGVWQTKWTTRDFWATFPTWIPAAVAALVVCGFVVVYFLGAKGYCTNACPYGGVLGAVDQLAPLRIRVTDACEGCGHCTAVCSSNVRVHEEVREFGMVVDPGCMKCLDCVSVCPNNALYVGWGTPALFASPRTPRREPSNRDRRAPSIARWALLITFIVASFAVFMGFDVAFEFRPVDWQLIGMMSAVALLIILLLRPRSPRRRPLHLGEEAVLAAGFLASMLLFRGLHDVVAYLFALGLAAIVAYLGLQAVLLLWRRDLSMHGFRLKRGGRWLPAGYGLAGLVASLGVFGAYAGTQQVEMTQTRRMLMEIEQLERSATATQPADAGRERLLELYRQVLLREPDRLEPALGIGRLLMEMRNNAGAEKVFQDALRRHPGNAQLLTNVGVLEATRGDYDRAIEHFRAAVRADPALPQARSNLLSLLAVQGQWSEVAEHLQALAGLRPEDPEVRAKLALCYGELGRFDDAFEQLDRARELARGEPRILTALENMRLSLQERRGAPPASQPAP
ncbi:MAG: tetratricopeptide repeat protein [Phycisphaerae bacterium]